MMDGWILLIEYIPRGTTYNNEKCTQRIIRNLETHHSHTQKILLLQDNCKVQEEINQRGFEELQHPAYSPYLALFQKLLRGCRFSANDDLENAVGIIVFVLIIISFVLCFSYSSF